MAQVVKFQTVQTLLVSIALLTLLLPLRPAASLLAFLQARLVYHSGNHKNRVSKSEFLNSSTTDILDHAILVLWGLLCAL